MAVVSEMSKTKYRWVLREFMARYKVKTLELAEEMKTYSPAISKLRSFDTIPPIGGEKLTELCEALETIIRSKGVDKAVDLSDLIECDREE